MSIRTIFPRVVVKRNAPRGVSWVVVHTAPGSPLTSARLVKPADEPPSYPPEREVQLYDALIATHPAIERKGAMSPASRLPGRDSPRSDEARAGRRPDHYDSAGLSVVEAPLAGADR
jgi:hypothetical protein